MDAAPTIAAPDPAPAAPRGRWWPAVWAALLLWQLWLAVGLFGPAPFTALTDDRPIISGAHPQHLYIGTVGAEAFARRWRKSALDWRTSAFDTAFQAGYPKTPIFDGSRLAELCLILGGGTYQPAAYKIGLVGECLLVPILLLVGCRAAGLARPAALLATVTGQLVWWGPLGRGALDAGDSELLLASLAGLAHIGLLIAFHRRPGVLVWLGLAATGTLGWFLQPLLFPIALPLLLTYYLCVGVKHDFSTWHVAFWIAEQAPVVINLPWLVDWVAYWWLRSPLPTPALVPHRGLHGLWNASLWGGPADRLLTILVMASAAVGVVILNQTKERPTARLFGLGATGALALALLGVSWEPLGLVGTAALLAPALWFAAVPAAHAWTWVGGRLWALGRPGKAALAVLAGVLLLVAAGVTETATCLAGRCACARPLQIGLSARQQEIVDLLGSSTTGEARVLWEDRPRERQASRWAALLPVLTGRSFVGGLDPDGFIEHSSICLQNQSLGNRPVAGWTDDQLAEYCQRYNVGWIAAWTPAVRQRFEAWPGAEKVADLFDGEAGCLFHVRRPFHYALKGRAELLQSDGEFITLGNVVPENGVDILSLHYQAGMRALPSRVQIEREVLGDDPIGFLRLRLAEPAARVTITWAARR
jgi:hypothetical protein